MNLLHGAVRPFDCVEDQSRVCGSRADRPLREHARDLHRCKHHLWVRVQTCWLRAPFQVGHNTAAEGCHSHQLVRYHDCRSRSRTCVQLDVRAAHGEPSHHLAHPPWLKLRYRWIGNHKAGRRCRHVDAIHQDAHATALVWRISAASIERAAVERSVSPQRRVLQ